MSTESGAGPHVRVHPAIESIDAAVWDALANPDPATLNRAVGRVSGTGRVDDAVGNIGIAGHRDGFFRRLKDIGLGDQIVLRTHRGTNTYAVDSIEVVTPDDVSVLENGEKPSVTLITCYPFYYIGDAPLRYIVRATLRVSAK